MSYHDLRSNKSTPLPKSITSLLGLGLKFCPNPKFTTNSTDIKATLDRYDRDLMLKHYFFKHKNKTNNDDDAVDDDFNARLYVKSKWTPPPWDIHPELTRRTTVFSKHYKKLYHQKHGTSNLLPLQRRGLRLLQADPTNIIVQCDKNLGPAIIETQQYINLAFRDHLSDNDTYHYVNPNEALLWDDRIRTLLTKWLNKWKKQVSKMERKFIKAALTDPATDAIATLYLTMKVHKSPLKTRPIVSCSGTLLYALGIWVDDKLQRVATRQKSYFKSSTILKDEIINIIVPSKGKLFTADAVSMYTNIDTKRAIPVIARYLKQHEAMFPDVPTAAVVEALEIVMKNNVFRFGDTTWHQLTGTAMGTPPAPPYATLYYAVHEDIITTEFPNQLHYYRRFIDDIFGVWIPDNDKNIDDEAWQRFQVRLNDFGLTWEVSDRVDTVNYMDLTILLANGRMTTTLFEKSINPYLYIPPHSAHPPGVLNGLLHGTIHRIQSLCSEPADRQARIKKFCHRLLARGYKPSSILPLLRQATNRVPSTRSIKVSNSDRIFLHVPYHQDNPKSFDIQSLWKKEMLRPMYKRHLTKFTDVNRLVVAYKRPRNLANLLSSRIIDTKDGPPASSYLHMIRSTAGAPEREREREIERERERPTRVEPILVPPVVPQVEINNPINMFQQFARR